MASTIVLLGPPGSGKGTQAEHLRRRRLADALHRDLLREARSQGTELGGRRPSTWTAASSSPTT
jgi:adenylate kinase family enzyme